jgi:hypothetical protein
VSAPYLRKPSDLLVFHPCSSGRDNHRIHYNWKFRLKYLFCAYQFMGLTPELRHVWHFGYTLCVCFVPMENLIQF